MSGTRYTVIARRWAHGWELQIRDREHEVGVTQSETLDGAEHMARHFLATLTGEAPEAFELEMLPEQREEGSGA